jgi:phospholipase C
MQENHSFDNFFASWPGLAPAFTDLTAPVPCIPYSLSNPSKGCVKPWNADSNAKAVETGSVLAHTYGASHMSYDGGKIDGFVQAATGGKSQSFQTYPMSYFDGQIIPYYWDLAEHYTLDANFFSSSLSYSWPNHLEMVAATEPSNCYTSNCKPVYSLTLNPIVSELTQKGISWA